MPEVTASDNVQAANTDVGGEAMIPTVTNPTFSARVDADPVHWGNRRFETSENTREGRALSKYVGLNSKIKAFLFMQTLR